MFKQVSIIFYFEFLMEWLFKLLFFVTPLIFVTNTNELYEFPKMFFVYIVGSTVIFLFFLKLILNPRKLSWPNKWVLMLLGSYIVSTVLSMNIYTSLFGYYSRFNGGLVSVLIFSGLYFVLINEFTFEKLREFLLVSALSLFPISVYSVVQHYGFLAGLLNLTSTVRAYSTFGQPNWLAAYICMLMPFLFLNVKTRFWLALFLVSYAGLWFTYSMSGFLAFLFAVVAVVALNYRFVMADSKRYGLITLLVVVFSVANLGIFTERVSDSIKDVGKFFQSFEFYTVVENVYAAASVPLPKPSADSYNVSDAGFIRSGLWKSTLQLVTSSPKVFLFGTGPETFPYSIQPFRIPELNYSSEWDFILNKPHNFYLEILAQNGLLGIIPYIGLIIYSLRKFHPLIFPSLVGFYVTNLFGWPTVSTALLFWLLIAALEKYYDRIF